jgi:hypothetical protein
MVWSVTPTTVDALGLEPGLGLFQLLHAVDLEGDVLHPGRRVLVAPHGGRVGQLEEGQHVAVAGVHEQVHVGVGRVRAGHLVFGDGQHEVHAQVSRYHSTVCLASLQR